MGNTEATLEAEQMAPLEKKKLEEDDVEYVKLTLSNVNLTLECEPRADGVGCQYTPLGWAIYYNSRKVITYIIHLPEVDITRHVGWWYESALPDSSLSPLVERLAPKISFTKTLYSVTGLDLAVILGNVEVVEEMMRLSLSWNRKFHDPLGWALDWAKKLVSRSDWLGSGLG
eukprot:TRINITY_DN4375_c0_g1_i4.p1 TRINITY_DN4375_c0_g1~~TRINITY_DN4375_c0_g1_i4.p1  ORF type:complete len:172 (-),score=32.75 TRINITY_DN4375_c0_g1_i4:986-1501(-)